MQSKAQGSRPRTQKKSEAKDSPTEDRHSRGQGQANFSFDLDFPNLNPTYLNDVFKNADDNDDELNIDDTYIDTNEAKVILGQNRTYQFSSLYVNARSLVNPFISN